MPRRLKVFRTTIGFHDAYVAAPSRKAALAAWGATKDLFAMEAAEEVTDTELMEEPLAHPSQVIQKVRGSLEQQLDALKATFAAQSDKAPQREHKVSKPSRAALDKAEAALVKFEQQGEDRLAKLRKREASLAKERADLEREIASGREELESRREKADQAYRSSMTEWRSAGS